MIGANGVFFCRRLLDSDSVSSGRRFRNHVGGRDRLHDPETRDPAGNRKRVGNGWPTLDPDGCLDSQPTSRSSEPAAHRRRSADEIRDRSAPAADGSVFRSLFDPLRRRSRDHVRGRNGLNFRSPAAAAAATATAAKACR